ncbi:MAG: hypothetical protein GX640_18590 [Fibrobacter sp.]|nr:hypothetical protein [Fibrobacter sp.]
MSGAGKGDTYRKVDKKKFDNSYETIFGKKDELDFQKGIKISRTVKSSANSK